MNISAEAFGALFDSFRREAFRLEGLDDYTGSSSAESLRAYFAGEQKPAGYNAEWLAQVRRNTCAGRRMYRVHVLSRPLSDYLRYELDWGYRTNQAAGEEFFILDVTKGPNPLEGVPDFWTGGSGTRTRERGHRQHAAGTAAGQEVRRPDEEASEKLRHAWQRHGFRPIGEAVYAMMLD